MTNPSDISATPLEQNEPPQSAEASSPEKVNFDFFGKTGEFFGIWIVNVLLSIVTLGIYSAWAKVRTYQYFYGNTEIDGHRFTYLATPIQILKGRIIAVVLFVLYSVVSSVSPAAGGIFMLLLIVATPFLICASLRFNLRMTSYRNVRFNFTGGYWQALVNFILLPILSVFTLYLLLPWVLKRIDQFLLENSQYGDKQFQPELSTGHYYKTAILTVLLTIGLFLMFLVAMSMIMGVSMSLSGFEQASASSVLLPFFMFAMYLAIIAIVSAYYQASIRNHVFDSTELEDVAEFKSSYDFLSLAWLQASNMMALIGSFGLAYPWTKIRKARYVVEHTEVYALPGKDSVIDHLTETSSSIGDEVANAFDIDVALT